jgi:DNA-binding MarR family transcriptional regulator
MFDTTTYLITVLQRAHRANLGPRLAKLRLHPGADLALAEICRHQPVTPGELARRLDVKPPSVTKVVRGLERQGLVQRIGDSEDARVSWIRPTAEGKRVERGVADAWLAAERETLAPLSPSDAAALHALLAKARLSRSADPDRLAS